MIGAVPRRAVTMSIQAIIGWKNPVDRIQKVDVGPRACLDDRQTRGCMRYEYIEQTVPEIINECCSFAGDIDS